MYRSDCDELDNWRRPLAKQHASWSVFFDMFKALAECAISIVLFAAALIAASILWKLQ